jgi:alkanesulfonate monooxygenase SsuD/methylene tetrahydromethanopterin reductase-like flavin-dependent oxidoreductase (luciferase family)
VFAAALAGRTKKARITISALLATLYDPVKLAEDLAVLDLASRGRVATTLGMGYRAEEYASFGKDFAERGKLLDDCIDVLLKAWSGEPFQWRGRTVRVTPRPYTQPHPPIQAGGQSLAGARRAARFGLPYQPASNDAAMLALYQSECARLGKKPVVLPPGRGETIWIARDPERAWRELGPYLLYEATTYASWQPASQQSSAVHSRAKSLDELRAEGKYLVLTPEECVARAKQQGPFASFILYPLCGGTPPELGWESVKLLCEEVLPRV